MLTKLKAIPSAIKAAAKAAAKEFARVMKTSGGGGPTPVVPK